MTQQSVRRFWLALAMALSVAYLREASSVLGFFDDDKITDRQRVEAIRHAQVWMKTDVARMDLRAGPRGDGSFAPFKTVTCDYVEKKMGGSSRKFTCRLAPEDEVKVKYGADNVEVFGEVAATRLLWALGFGADRMYPVKVICRGCPADPKKNPSPATGTVTFDPATIERKTPGRTLESKTDEGWDWSELDLIDDKVGGAPKAHREALRLLAAFIQHSDSKPPQQRLICLPKGAAAAGLVCSMPFMLIHDVGLTFGKANLTNSNSATGVNFENWSKKPIWEDEKKCVAKLADSYTGTLTDPKISEPGRKFLSDLLEQLSDAQLRDLFEVARFQQFSRIPTNDWIAVFKKKRQAIRSAVCPG